MSPRLFLISLIAISLFTHLLRFPHLILENGGGAFLILFFLALNVFALPLLLTERTLDKKMAEIDIRSLIRIRKASPLGPLDSGFLVAWFGLRVLILLSLFWFFLYLGSSSLIYFSYFLMNSLNGASGFNDIPTVPELNFNLIGTLIWATGSMLLFFYCDRKFINFSVRWILPFCFICLFVLFLKILFLVSDFSGLKILFYPDFMALNANSLSSIFGHTLLCLLIGLGFYRQHLNACENTDVIELFIRASIQTLAIAIMVGVMALPMIEQVSETPFGSNWLFLILPRWLSYGDFGNYYCSLFFLCLAFLALFIGVSLISVMDSNLKMLFHQHPKKKVQWTMAALFTWISAALVVFLQNHVQGWSGQSLMIAVDEIVVDYLLPLLALAMVWVTFRYTQDHERLTVFHHQQLFYHSRSFFKIWERITVLLVPILILTAWFLRLKS